MAVRRADRVLHTVLPGRHPRRGTHPTAPLRVLMPRGLTGLARESGIGAAVRHQETVVRSLGHRVVTNPLRPFDVVHLNTPFPDTPVLARWARLWRRPVLVWAHSTEDDFRDSFPGSNRLAPLFRRWISHLYRLGDAVVTPSDYSRTLVSAPKYGVRRPIHVLSNGVDTDFFRPDPSARERLRRQLGVGAEEQVVISVGMQLVRKGILDWVEVARRMPEVTFVWYGRTDARLLTVDVEAALATAPPNARFPGFVRPEQLRDAYGGADAFCFLTKEETEGIVLLEALACGVPALVRSIPIYRGQMPDGVLTHQVAGEGPQFIDDVVERLGELLGGDLPDLTGEGRRAAEALDLREIAARLQEIYLLAGVIPHRPGPRRELRTGAEGATARAHHRGGARGAGRVAGR